MEIDALYAARRRHEQLLQLNIDETFRKQHGVWCVFFDELVKFMGWPVGLYAPGLDKPDALVGVFRVEKGTLWGMATFSMSEDANSPTVAVSFGVSPGETHHPPNVWTISTLNGTVKGFFDNASPQLNQKLLRDTKEAVRQALVGSA